MAKELPLSLLGNPDILKLILDATRTLREIEVLQRRGGLPQYPPISALSKEKYDKEMEKQYGAVLLVKGDSPLGRFKQWREARATELVRTAIRKRESFNEIWIKSMNAIKDKKDSCPLKDS